MASASTSDGAGPSGVRSEFGNTLVACVKRHARFFNPSQQNYSVWSNIIADSLDGGVRRDCRSRAQAAWGKCR